MNRTLLGLSLTIVLACSIARPCLAAGTWRAGAASQKITPKQPMWMAGYGSRDHAATGTLNDLHAKALVLEDDAHKRVAIVSLDLVGIGPDVTEPILAQLESRFQLPRSNVALCCSHTHSGPVVGINLRTMHLELLDAMQRELIEKYAADLRTAVVETVGRAVAALAPSEISWGQGQATFAVNRRNNKEPDAPRLRAEGKLVGPIDHAVPVLRVTDTQGKLTAVLFGYACHATVLSGYEWCSDYPGYAQSELETKHPGSTALFFAGCGADQNPLPRRTVELAQQYGRELATAVDKVLAEKLEPISGRLQTSAATVTLDLAQVPTSAEVDRDAASSDKYVAARARRYQQMLKTGESIPGGYPYPIQLWRLGPQLKLVTLGGEVVVDYALRIKQDLGPADTWVAGYANDVMAYIPSRRVLTEGGYEGGGAMVYYGLPSPWAPTVEERIIDAVNKLAKQSP